MTKNKRGAHRYPTTRTAAASEKSAKVAVNGPLTLKDYVLLNVIFDLFCIVQLIIVSLLLKGMPGLIFFFVFIMVGFLIVSAFDYIASCMTTDDEDVTDVGPAQGDVV